MTDVEGILAEKRLREISDELYQLRGEDNQGNIFLIQLLEMERKAITDLYIRVV